MMDALRYLGLNYTGLGCASPDGPSLGVPLLLKWESKRGTFCLPAGKAHIITVILARK